MRTERIAAACVLVALAAAGCGGGGGGGGTESHAQNAPAPRAGGSADGGKKDGAEPEMPQLPPQAQVDLAIKSVLASGVPGLACDRYATANYVQTAFGGKAGCVKSTVPASAASSVAVSDVKIEGEAATARAVPSGGPSGGETIRVELVRKGSLWKVDSLRSNAPVGP